MSSALKTLRSNLILQSIALVVAGLILLVVPNVTMMTLVFVIAFLLTLMGAWALISYFRNPEHKDSESSAMPSALIYGVALLILPIIMFIMPGVFVTFISMLAGILLFLSGVVNMMRSMKLRKNGDRSWMISLLISILIAGAGVLLVVDPFGSATMFVRVLGTCMVINGLADLLLVFWSRNLDVAR